MCIGEPARLVSRDGIAGTAMIDGRETLIDLSLTPDAKAGDVVTLIGSDGGCEITVDEVAELADTICYEILTGLRPRLPRVEKNG